jgi:predicted protein tyrosine phosphatase
MRTVDIRDYREAQMINEYYDAVVSVIEGCDVDFGHPNHIVERMGDYGKSYITWASHDLEGVPKKEQFERILKFVNTLPENAKILVHCAAGISRSTATGLGILASEGWSDTQAVQHLLNKHPQDRAFWPNDIILGHFDEILGTNLEVAVRGKAHVGDLTTV